MPNDTTKLAEVAAMEILEESTGDHIDMRDDYDPLALAYLERHGYAQLDKVLSGHVGVVPTTAGQVELSRFRTRRGDRVERALALRNGYLRYLWEEDEQGAAPTPDSFLLGGPTWLGSPYTSVELERAGAWLKDAGLISGQGAWGYDGPLRPKLTMEGRDIVESGRSVTDRAVSGHTAYTTNISGGNVNLAQGSTNVSQRQDNRDASEAALNIVATVLERIQEIGVEHRSAVEAAAEELRSEAEGQRRGTVLRDLGTKILTSVATSGAGQLVATLGPLIQDLLTRSHA